MSRPSKWARMDWLLLVNALALCAIGLLNVYSGTRVHGVPGTALVTKQLALDPSRGRPSSSPSSS